MTSAPTPPVIYSDGVYAPILTVLLDLMTPDERRSVEEILRIRSRSENGEAS